MTETIRENKSPPDKGGWGEVEKATKTKAPLIREVGGFEGSSKFKYMDSAFKNKKIFIPYNKNLTKKARENRKNPTVAERKLWYEVLRNKEFESYKFIRQKQLDNFIVDFYCSKLLLIIEIDGDSHTEQIDYDILRTKKLNSYGIKIVRYTNLEVINNIEGVYDDLKRRIERRKVRE